MKLRILLVAAAALLLSQPGFADLRKYDLGGDQSTEFPTNGTILRPGTNTGTAFIDDVGPVLQGLTVRNAFVDTVGGTLTSGIPGTTVTLDSRTDFGPTLPGTGQTGTGSVATTINWGALTTWQQTGRLVCITHCPGGCPSGVSSCVPFVGFEGTGPPAPLVNAGASFTFDPFTFSGGGASFSTPSVEIVNLVGGAVTANGLFTGTRVFGSVPAIPLAALGGLGAGLVYLGARALRRKQD